MVRAFDEPHDQVHDMGEGGIARVDDGDVGLPGRMTAIACPPARHTAAAYSWRKRGDAPISPRSRWGASTHTPRVVRRRMPDGDHVVEVDLRISRCDGRHRIEGGDNVGEGDRPSRRWLSM
ncbi:hypothetical protein FOB84_02155 [Gordonia bronchialis]|uniref:hypothetical protein n=1 Tax=Gordonia bronchialis TaxID=2054 RepID=UPI00019B97FB|nr:hypothetical protein [Gordonia bronchialis]MCC3321641.1 hypothetical protein [Gordonia bronchialis]QGS23161.1 hypothetical protein FOB84_02155 [Gordonia bronchialis]UAK36545.1 hypothetical protein K8O93_14800 [Gordonia bronchialis]